MSTTFWQEHQVGGPYFTAYDSDQALIERERQFPGLYDLMPVEHPGKTVLDYGCGPGHDTILMIRGGAKKVWFTDISAMALRITSDRLVLHGLREQGWLLPITAELPAVDHVHCAGVLHHIDNPLGVLAAFRRALPLGEARVMVYDGDISDHSQSEVPITTWWTRAEFLSLAAEAGFQGEWVGSYPCSAEWRPNCHAACYRLT